MAYRVKVLPLALLLLILVISAIIVYVVPNNTQSTHRISSSNMITPREDGKLEFSDNNYILLTPPPNLAIGGGGIVVNNGNTSIPPLNTSNIFIIAYYDVNQDINLTQASQLPGLIVDKWGFSYFDGRYIIIDPHNVPDQYYSKTIITVYLRVRSDGWILTWINKSQSLGDIVLSGLDLKNEIGQKDPWISKKITSLSYTIYKILEQVNLVSDDDSDNDGIPDDLVTISNNVGYYDYKYAGVSGKYGYLAIIGAKSYCYKIACRGGGGYSYGLFDFTVSNAYTINESVLLINAYLYKGYDIMYYAKVYVKLGEDPNPPEIFSRQTCSGQSCGPQEIYIVREKINVTSNISTGIPYYAEIKAEYNYLGGSCGCSMGSRIEAFYILIGVLKS